MGIYNPPVPVFMKTEDKEEWQKKKLIFNIVSARSGKGKFSDNAYTYELQNTDAKTAEVVSRFITLSGNTRREVEFEFVSAEIAKDGYCGPCRLDTVPGQGNDAWVFVGA